MKFLMKVGDQLDLNVAYNGGAADSGLLYTAPENNGVLTVVGATGVVTALAKGDSVVQVFHGTPSVLVATIMIEVATVAEYAEMLAIRQGANPVVIGSAAVIQELAAVGTLFAYQPQAYGMTIESYITPSSAGLIAGPQSNAFDGSAATTLRATAPSSLVALFKNAGGNLLPLMVRSVKIKFTGAVDAVGLFFENSNGDMQAVTVSNSLISQDGGWSTFILGAYASSIRFKISPSGAAITANGYWEIKDVQFYV